ncbi:MAG TPA: RodZ domain-containing protein [Casimicrobiaceae bacterium]|nr:RodZ domain-containing protein [Casimicrobiaceae bacterium]
MTGSVDAQPGTANAGPSSATAGTALKAAREAAGLSLDAVAQQLRLAPRQVQALEDDDYQRLPGRTFVRGFARNYARFVHLDPEGVLAKLPAADAAPALERPTLAPTRRPMGELPVEGVARRSALRWLIPLLLLCIVAAAGFYEYTRQQAALRAAATRSAAAEPASGAAIAPVPAPETASATSVPAAGAAAAAAPAQDGKTVAAPATPAAPGTRSTPLPNPLTGSPAAADPGAAAPAAAVPAQPSQPGTPASAGAQDPPATGGSAARGDGSAAVAGQVPLVMSFRGRSWVEVRDAGGRVLLQSTEAAGATRTVSGTPPFELALGNAPQVDVTFGGRAVDLRPYTRANVARISLK